MKRVVYHVEARLDVLEIVEYYEREAGVDVADRFTAELERFVERVAETPLAYREFERGIRRANLDRFPHHILYRILDEETIKVISVKHDHRQAVLWHPTTVATTKDDIRTIHIPRGDRTRPRCTQTHLCPKLRRHADHGG